MVGDSTYGHIGADVISAAHSHNTSAHILLVRMFCRVRTIWVLRRFSTIGKCCAMAIWRSLTLRAGSLEVCQICVILTGNVVESAHSCLMIVETCWCWQRLVRALQSLALRRVAFLLLVLLLKLHGVPVTLMGTREQLLG